MKKMLKQNKGFSLIELLVAILIMAVVAGTAIMLFGGVLSSSRESADKETAENIKRAILTYINLTNDDDLSCLRGKSGGDGDGGGALNDIYSINLLQKLACSIDIGKSEKDKVKFTAPANAKFDGTKISAVSGGIDDTDITGTFGPFLDAAKPFEPQQPGLKGWKITIDVKTQVVTVEADSTDAKVEFK